MSSHEVAVRSWVQWKPKETERAFRGSLIDSIRLSTLNREQSLELFHQQFAARDDAHECEPCAMAVLDAAGK